MATKNESKNENTNDWDDLTDSFITGIDDTILKDSEIKLRDILMKPSKYAQKLDANITLKKMQSAINTYFSEVNKAFSSDQEKLNSDLESISVTYSKIMSVLNEKATSLKVPFIIPYTIDIKGQASENIIIDSYNSSIELLISKLIYSSKYIADMSTKYKEHTLGSWIFSSDRLYILTIKPPESVIIDIENSQEILNNYLNSFSDEINLYKNSNQKSNLNG
ncbi:MAG: hypothetical protein QXD23_00865 [Candidatus Micrarchaeaceae archaeon]